MDVKSFQDHNGAYFSLWEQNLFCDLDVVAKDGAPFRVHQLLLLNLGAKFQKILLDENESVSKDNILRLDLPRSVVYELIYFSYMGKCCINEDNVKDLVRLGKEYDIRSLRKVGHDYLVSKLSPANAIYTFKLAKDFFCSHLKAYVRRFILQNFISINKEDFKNCSVSDLVNFLKDDELNTSEVVLFQTIEDWVATDQSRGEALANLVKYVRFPLMLRKDFETKVLTSSLAKRRTAAKVIEEARGFILKLGKARSSTLKIYLGSSYLRSRIPPEIVLSFGGWCMDPHAPTDSMETFDFRASKWQKLKCTCIASVAYHGLVELDRKVYLFGGFNGKSYWSETFTYDPNCNEWEERAPMDKARCYVSSAVLNGKIYALGGFDGIDRQRSVECYDQEANSWTPVAPMNDVRSDACAVAFDGKLYVVGGFTGETILSTVDVYDPVTGTWSHGPRLNCSRSGVKAVVYQQKIYALGGFDGINRLRSVECLDPRSIDPGWQFAPEMQTRRSNFAVTIVDEKILVMGGFEGPEVTSKTEFYCGKTKTWTALPDMSESKSALSVLTLSGLQNTSFFVNRERAK